MEEIILNAPSMQGKIYIGGDVFQLRLPSLLDGHKNIVITDANVYALYNAWFAHHFSGVRMVVLPVGEESKSFNGLQTVLSAMVEEGLHRDSRVFAVGGGVIGDLAGFAAASYMRGVSLVQIPTTLLSQVDSSVGGKTAINFHGVKNVIGAFYQPCEVLIDPNFLNTLPDRELKCGLGEIVKYAALSEDILENLEQSESWTEIQFIQSIISACVRHKVGVVERDEKESGERRSLNVGHTTGHAIELVSGLSHGESVLYGMLYETRMAINAGVCHKEYGKRLLKTIEKGLQLSPTTQLDKELILFSAKKAKTDKKNEDDGKVQMAVAAQKGVWKMFALPYQEYYSALNAVVEE